MNKLIALSAAFLLIIGIKATAQPQRPFETVSLDRGWKFHFGHAGDPSKDFNFGIANLFSKSGKAEGTAVDPGFDDSGWRTLDLPHDWAVELPFVFSRNFDVQSHGYKPVGGLFPETSIGWYRKHFSLQPSDSSGRFYIRFDGIFRDAQCWLNGFYLGRNESGYVGVTWDITDYVNFFRENVLVIRVDATQYEGWFYEGAGIYRHVWLEKKNPLHIIENGVFVRAVPAEGTAEIDVDIEIRNENPSPVDFEVFTTIRDRDGKTLARDYTSRMMAVPNAPEEITKKITIPSPRRWSVEDPYLYRASVIVRSGRRTVDSVTVRFGIRTIRFDADSGFFLNGRNIKIQGVCCHQDHAGVGAAVPDFLQYYRISLLKEMGANAYRSSHNAPAPEVLEACDSLGMLVLDEQRLMNSSPEYAGQFEGLIRRDRNHPSVVLWSIGNEEGYIQTTGTGKRIALSMMETLEALDPTRTCTYAADLPNVFQGINEVIPVRGFNYRQFAVADYHKSHPEQPVIGTEMGSTVTTRGIPDRDTVKCYLPDQDITAPWWASTAEEWWTLCAGQPWWGGGFIWTGFDYRGEPTPFQWPNINSHFGVMDMCGFPKNIYYYYQSWWTGREVLHLSPHWNLKAERGEPVKVWVNSNAREVRLLLNGKSMGQKVMPQNGHLEWVVPYQPGRLEAIGLFPGKRVSANIETTGAPAAIILTPAKTSLRADGLDGTVINVTVTDREGRPVPDATNLIRFRIKGFARIIGTGNGDPSSHEPDQCPEGKWQRSLFSGKCQIILQSGRFAGPVTITAQSEGLEEGKAVLELK